ncbi:MAG: hypothetical protein HZB23_06295 [Deltaproteobacteria bacterium]|nr:hypothetical protein [Deltaproteobacteria bacterium]
MTTRGSFRYDGPGRDLLSETLRLFKYLHEIDRTVKYRFASNDKTKYRDCPTMSLLAFSLYYQERNLFPFSALQKIMEVEGRDTSSRIGLSLKKEKNHAPLNNTPAGNTVIFERSALK